jgi:hypothetical protein
MPSAISLGKVQKTEYSYAQNAEQICTFTFNGSNQQQGIPAAVRFKIPPEIAKVNRVTLDSLVTAGAQQSYISVNGKLGPYITTSQYSGDITSLMVSNNSIQRNSWWEAGILPLGVATVSIVVTIYGEKSAQREGSIL